MEKTVPDWPPHRGPRPTRPGGVALSASRSSLLAQLETRAEPVTATALAQHSGLHPNTVREHLEALARAGLVLREPAPPRGRGRPGWRYRAAPSGAEYAGLATALAGSLRRTSTDPVADAILAGRDWGRALAAAHPCPDQPGPATAQLSVLTLLASLGFSPRPEPAPAPGSIRGTGPVPGRPAPGGTSDHASDRVRLTSCPLLAAARQDPEIVCAVHLGLVRGAAQAYGGRSEQVELAPFAEPDACLLRLDPGEPAS